VRKHYRYMIAAWIFILLFSACSELAKLPVADYWDDYNIKSEVKSRLAADNALRGSRIEVESDQGVVYLTGVVATAEQKTRAAQIAFKVPGVHGVGNQLEFSKVP